MLCTAAGWFATGRGDDLLHRADVVVPGGGLGIERFAPERGELVVARSAATLGDVPLGGDELFLRHAVEGGVQRAVLDLQAAVGDRLDPLRDAEAVLRTPREGTEDQEFERTLKDVEHRAPLESLP